MTDQLAALGWGEPWTGRFAALDRAAAEPGRVVRHDGRAVLVATEEETRSLPVLATVDPPPVVGDWVAVARGAVVATLPRSSLLRRQAPAGGEQPLVANIDLVLVVCGLDRPVKPGRVQRSATLAWDAGATPVVVLTKADLAANPEAAAAGVELANPGVEVIVLSAATGDGVDELRARIGHGTVVLLGESGAGKSTLTNALVPGAAVATAATRSGDGKGRHTTTARQLHRLPGGGALVDTPGTRAVGLWVDPEAVAATFDDIAGLAGGCRFADCAHAAVENGTLPAGRLEAWRGLEREAAASARRADEHARRAHERRFGRVVREAIEHKRSR